MFQLGAHALGVPRFGAGAQRLAHVLGAERVRGLLDGGQDLVVTGRKRFGWRETVLGVQFQDGLACDLEPLQRPFGGGELLAELGDLLTQPFVCDNCETRGASSGAGA
ncbi:hypothetical protein [Streptomyces sp. NPDC000851]